MLTRQAPNDLVDEVEKATEQPRCIKCYSADVTCHEIEKPLSYAGANLFDPITVHARSCTCNSWATNGTTKINSTRSKRLPQGILSEIFRQLSLQTRRVTNLGGTCV